MSIVCFSGNLIVTIWPKTGSQRRPDESRSLCRSMIGRSVCSYMYSNTWVPVYRYLSDSASIIIDLNCIIYCTLLHAVLPTVVSKSVPLQSTHSNVDLYHL